MGAAKIKKGDSVVVRRARTRAAPAGRCRSMPKDGKVWCRASTSPRATASRPRRTRRAGSSAAKRRWRSPRSRIADPKTGKPTRVRFEVTKDGKKVRVAVKSGEKIDG